MPSITQEQIVELVSYMLRSEQDKYCRTAELTEEVNADSAEVLVALNSLRAIGVVELKPGTEVKNKEKWWRPTSFYRELGRQLMRG